MSKNYRKVSEADYIMGATNASGELVYLVKFKNNKLHQLVTAEQARIKLPEVVIRFLERRIVVEDGTSDENHKAVDDDENIVKVAEKIICVTYENGGLVFLIKWKGFKHPARVTARKAYIMCPQLAIRFLEQKLTWVETDTDNMFHKPTLRKH